MKIGIIETGKPSATLLTKFGNYPDMFAQMLHANDPSVETFAISVVSGETLPQPDAADGWLITGSRHGAYDELSWISDLKIFVKNCISAQIPLIGVCFGHQIIAEAMGGKVEKSNKGWQVGPRNYQVSNKPDWMDKIGDDYASHAIHQDQITALPDGSTVIASTEHCPYAAIVYGDSDQPAALTIQSHPELPAEFVKEISEERLSRVVDPEVLKSGLVGLGRPVQNAEWATIFSRYFQRTAKT